MTQLAPGRSLGFVLADVSRLFHQVFEKAVERSGLGLTAGEIRALAHVTAYDGSRQATLAEVMGVEPMTLSVYIDRLESQGLVIRQPDPTDRRAKVVRTTADGARTFGEIGPIAEEIYGFAIQTLSAEQVAVLEAALVAMRGNLSPEPLSPASRRGRTLAPDRVA